MQNDVTDGVRWLIEQGIADPERIGIYGSSYGGYAALMGLVKATASGCVNPPRSTWPRRFMHRSSSPTARTIS